MRTATVHPHDATISISSDAVEDHSRCSLSYLLQTRRRRCIILTSLFIVILICSIAIPLEIIFGLRKNTQQPMTTTEISSSTTYARTTNDLMTSTFINASFASNSTWENRID